MNKPKVIVFDWDGTLIDSLPLKIRNAGLLFAARFGVSSEAVETAYRRHSGIPRRQLFDAICAELGLPGLSDVVYGEISQAFTDHNRRVLAGLQADRGVHDTLKDLQERGLPLYISTSAAPDEVRHLAQAVGLATYFREILGSEGVFSKGPAHIEYILAQLSLSHHQLWFVGDEPNDVRLGKAAGVLTIVKTGSHAREQLAAAGPDELIESLSDLIMLLDRS